MSAPVVTQGAAAAPGARRQRFRFGRLFKGNRAAQAGAVVVVLVVLMALLAPFVAPYEPEAIDLRARMQPPSAAHWFGTDELGRDVLSRVVWGARPSLLVGLVSVAMASLVGTLLGLVAGYAGGQLVDVVEDLVYGKPYRTVGADLAVLRTGEVGYFSARLTAGGIDTVKVVGACRPAVAQAE